MKITPKTPDATPQVVSAVLVHSYFGTLRQLYDEGAGDGKGNLILAMVGDVGGRISSESRAALAQAEQRRANRAKKALATMRKNKLGEVCQWLDDNNFYGVTAVWVDLEDGSGDGAIKLSGENYAEASKALAASRVLLDANDRNLPAERVKDR